MTKRPMKFSMSQWKTQKSHQFFHIPLHAFKVQTKTSLKSTWNTEKVIGKCLKRH
jgi:hypothetical protein